jgi:hypothetical protein
MMTEWSELSIRFAEYATSREIGRSRSQSATDAKEVSTNFDRSGARSQNVKNLVGFFNASVQGVNKYARFIKNPKTRKWIIGVALGQVAAGFLANWFNPDDEDENIYLSDFDRMSNTNIPGTNIKIPSAHWWRGFWAIGAQAAQVLHGKHTKTEAANITLSFIINELLPINLYEIGVKYDEKRNSITVADIKDIGANTLRSLTAIDPFVDIWANKDFKGTRIFYEDTFNTGKANKDLGKKDVHPVFQALSDWLFDISGGKTDKKGKVIKSARWDYNPSKIEHVVSSYFGGAPATIKDAVQAIVAAASGKEVNMNKVPIVNAFYRFYDEPRVFMSEYYGLRSLVQNWEGEETTAYKQARQIVEKGWGKSTATKIMDKKDVKKVNDSLSVASGIKEMRKLGKELRKQK